MILMEKKNQETTSNKFDEIKSVDRLIEYLSNTADRIKNTSNGSKRYVYHYTNFDKAKLILNGGCWRLGSPKKMNDGLEFSFLSQENHKELYYACFMYDSSESIAMWSMYGQPWNNGVMLRMPVESLKKWIKNSKEVYTISQENGMKPLAVKPASIIKVAYTNSESVSNDETEKIICGAAENLNFHNILNISKLNGYVKDMAWSYEREVRVLVSTETDNSYDAVFIKIPKEILETIEIYSGPRFEGNIEEIVSKEIEHRIMTKKSLFTGKLKAIACDNCFYKKGII